MKDEHTYCKKMARQGRKKVICKGTFISIQTLRLGRSKNLIIKNPINRFRLHQFLGTKTTEANKSLKTDATRA